LTKLIISPEARQDLQDIGDYIAYNNPIAAVSFVVKLEQRCSDIAQHSGLGRNRSNLQSGLRSFAEGNYLIFFKHKIANNTVEIVRIIHGYRLIEKIFKPQQ